MKVTTLLYIVHSAHLTWQVESEWEERGGIMLIAPPGQLKTTVVNSLTEFPDANVVGDMNVRSMTGIRALVLANRYRTLAFSEMEKLYARNPATAANIEGHLKQFVEEGLRHFSFEDSSIPIMPARCLVVSGMTSSLFAKFSTVWQENGFLRRFLRIQYIMKDEQALLEAIHKWKKLHINIPTSIRNGHQVVPYNLTANESRFVMDLLKEQPNTTPAVLLKKIAVILKHGLGGNEWRKILLDLAPGLGRQGAQLEL